MMPEPDPAPSAPLTSIFTTDGQHVRGDRLDRAVGGGGVALVDDGDVVRPAEAEAEPDASACRYAFHAARRRHRRHPPRGATPRRRTPRRPRGGAPTPRAGGGRVARGGRRNGG